MKITVLKYGESVFEENYLLRDGRSDVLLPISFAFYLIETSEKNILVDVGCDDGAGFEMSIFATPLSVLKDYGLSPDEITDVIITHAHHDHIAALSPYKNATIHIQKEEYIAGKDYIPADFKVHTFEEEFSLTEHICVKKIGGHTIGSSIVICEINEKRYVLCGDECYIKASFEKSIPSGNNWYPEISEQFIKKYSGNNDVPLLFHDPAILQGKVGYQTLLL